MAYLRRALFALLLFSGLAAAQVPDCPQNLALGVFQFSGGSGSVQIDNRATACVTFTLAYDADSTWTGTVALQSSNGTDTPSGFVTYIGTTVSSSSGFGSQSCVGTTPGCVATYTNLGTGDVVNTPWLKINVTGSGGSVRGVLYGYRTGPTGGTGGGGGGGGSGCPNPCPVHGDVAPGSAASNPVTVGARNDAGNVVAYNVFPDQADINASAVSAVKIVAGSAGKLIYVAHLSISILSATTVSITQGVTTSTPCDTSATTLHGPYQNIVALALDWDASSPLHTTTTGDDLCLLFGGSTTGGGGIVYAQR